jgi:hypothetical protein
MPHLRGGIPTGGDAAIAAWLEHPAPDRARSVPLRLPDISSPWRDALLAKTAGTAILQKKFKFLKIILATAKKTRFVRNACWDSAPHFILPLRLWLQSLTDFQALISKHEIRNKEKSPTSRIRQKCPSSNPKSLLSSSSSSSFQPSTFNLQPSTFNLQPFFRPQPLNIEY